MHAKKYIYIILILLLSMLIGGCDSCDDCNDFTTQYQGDPTPLAGRYLLSMTQETQSTSDKILGQKPESRKIEQHMEISVKDPKTLVAKFGPDGEPFYLDYNAKTGVATGMDTQGYKWEIGFAVDYKARDDEDIIVIYPVKRTGTSLLGIGSDNMHGESKTGIFYKYHGRWTH